MIKLLKEATRECAFPVASFHSTFRPDSANSCQALHFTDSMD